MKAKARAHTNIALVKYWGKADKALKLPLMSSISMTLDAFYTDTEFNHSQDLEQDAFYLNEIKQTRQQSQRVFNYINELRKKFNLDQNEHFEIRSYNHVPTSAGLASSASAFAALAASFAKSYDLNLDKTALSRLARLGSGSATRSIFGGFVEWQKGTNDETSFAKAIDENPDWDLHMLAVEVNTGQKKISSSIGMQWAQKSPFYQTWLNENQSEINALKKAIAKHDFTNLGEISEQSANEMHAVNLSANPGFTYFEPDTLELINLVHTLRQQGIECYYTIDAGPNVKILCTLRNSKEIISAIHNLLGNVKIVNASFGPGVQYLD
ncbi:diphosphomevalonate decarboxylase [Lactobacillus hominis]|uniref:diphosphomevalonate decarboxylase n=1 Tax=Lactobacillus hominis DSM 23910 = CRBIP 24.179 TaxID=1423758 RepID=I7LAT9_9LACO|nr:diphosphomevalonate decarboxylase [Lactobacillus hominis]KRM85052.1 diphosphomevalonate decarboxylase [Lactobacillus hominis DSM 23910 = CRBIP 24.179]MCT3348451.1 diphosphomevalonate decarboxylase [Lactobacillus hominis]CCI82564.1 Diphosphomevalonate decarboxylase [Lactobacillus hominis DSM 23910 = CRBIP 24.179]